MKGNDYFNWLNEEEKSRWLENFIKLNKTNPEEDFLNENFKSWLGFIGSSFEFRKTNEGDSYWGEVYFKYKKYDNLKVKPGFDLLKKMPKVI